MLPRAVVSSIPVQKRWGFDQGFEHFDDKFTVVESSFGSSSYQRGNNRVASATTDHARRWLSSLDDERPFFLWVHYVDPHAPYAAPEKFDAEWPEGTRGFVKHYDAEIHFVDKHLGRLLRRADHMAGPAGMLTVVTADHGEGLGDHGWLAHGINLYEEAVRIPMVY